jgi:glycosyltransferase involved in cell wall biosynthesis
VVVKSRSPAGDGIAIVFNGICARDASGCYHISGVAAMLRSLVERFGTVRYFGAAIGPGDAEFTSAREASLAVPGVELTLVSGNSGNTGAARFLRNNLIALFRLPGFVNRSHRIVVFLPSFVTVVAGLLALAFRKDLGVHIGTNWDVEARHRKLTPVRALFYPVNRYLVQPVALWIARRARFTITAGHDVFARLNSESRRVMLEVPFTRLSRELLYPREDTCQGGVVRLLYVGALRFHKGPMDALEAFARAREGLKQRPIELRFAGAGEAERELRKRIAELGLERDVTLLGHVPYGPGLHTLYRESDIFVFPTYSEGFPKVVWEAMTFGLPIITTPVAGIPFVLRHREQAYLVPPGDVPALASAMVRLVQDGALRRGMIRAAQTLMAESVFPRFERDRGHAHQIAREYALQIG